MHMSQYLPFLAFFLIAACENPGNSFNPCPSGSGELKDTAFFHDSEFYDMPHSFLIYPNSRVGFANQSYTKLQISAQQNVPSRLQRKQRGDTLILDYADCIRTHQPLNLTIVADPIDKVVLQDSCELAVSEYTADQLSLSLNEHVFGNFDANLGLLSIESNSDGNTVFSGRYRRLTAQLNEVQSMDMLNAELSRVSITFNAPAEFYLPEVDTVSVTFNGAGTLYYQGEPTILQNGNAAGKLVPLQ